MARKPTKYLDGVRVFHCGSSFQVVKGEKYGEEGFFLSRRRARTMFRKLQKGLKEKSTGAEVL